MKQKVLTITLNPAIDKTVNVPNFRIGKDFREEAMHLSAGGKGINVSRVLKHLGVPNTASGFLGARDGNYIKEQLKKEGIECDFCTINGNTRTSLTVIDPSLNTITRVLERGPKVTATELKRFKKKYLCLLKNCHYVIFSGRNIPGVPDSFYGELITIAKEKNIITVLDTSGKAYQLGFKKKPFMIKPNLGESEKILGEKLLSFSKIKQAAIRLYERGPNIVAITLGSRGAIVFNGKQMLRALPPKVKRKNPVGCGDAFIGGFIAHFARNKNLLECVRMAVACGAANALSINPGFIKSQILKKIFKQIKLKEMKIKGRY